MRVLGTVSQLLAWRDEGAAKRWTAWVPTMGFLHRGHASLLGIARARADAAGGEVVLSIFVNPTQFGAGEDYQEYPRDPQRDLEVARAAGVDCVFRPSDAQSIYPSGPDGPAAWVEVPTLARGLCGKQRPTHFRGVCTVLTKFWGLLRPDLAVFGEKDYQQLAIVRAMHRELFLSGEVVGGPTVREADGLALSSRNARLSADARTHATEIVRFLFAVRARFEGGERKVVDLLRGAEPMLAHGELEYVAIVDATTLEPLTLADRPAVVAIAATYAARDGGRVRLIDNLALQEQGAP